MRTILYAALVLLTGSACALAQSNPMNTSSPWGIASGAEKSGEYPTFNPMLADAGVRWIRYFPEWQSIQPEPGVWRWQWADKFVANAEENGMSVAGCLLYFAPWASADGKGTRVFPVRDMDAFRQYVRQTVSRYKDRIRYWEVWNEPNSPAFNRFGTPKDYADMVRAAYEEVQKIDPGIKIGITVAAHDVRWLNQVIRDGAADHFDYVCVHPYNSAALVFGSEPYFLWLRKGVRDMLDSSNQRQDIEIWISEIGLTTTEDPRQLRRQAVGLAKIYILGIVQGFEKIMWFEAMGVRYGDGVHAIISDDYKPYPAYHALKAMTGALGPAPRYVGWLNLGDRTYGFVFRTGEDQHALAIWAVGQSARVQLGQAVQMIDLTGQARELPADAVLELTDEPVFVRHLPASLVAEAQANRDKRFPWTPDFSLVDTVSIRLGPVNEENGIRQGNNDPRPDGITIPGTADGVGYRSTNLARNRPFIYFQVDPSFMGWNDSTCEITMVARRANPDQPATIRLVYESQTGYHEYGKRTPWPGVNAELLPESETYREPELWYLEKGEHWQEKTWRITDANFIGKWGWTFQVNVEPSAGDVWVSEVRVRRIDAEQ